MKVAIVHDWLVTYAGAERVLEQMLLCYPDAELYSLIDFVPRLGQRAGNAATQRVVIVRDQNPAHVDLSPLVRP